MDVHLSRRVFLRGLLATTALAPVAGLVGRAAPLPLAPMNYLTDPDAWFMVVPTPELGFAKLNMPTFISGWRVVTGSVNSFADYRR